MASTADALYTITTLQQTSSSVARNRILSDLSFRAIVMGLSRRPYRTARPLPRYRARARHASSAAAPLDGAGRRPASERSTVISQSRGGDTSFADRGGLRSQQPAPYRQRPTDD